MTNPQHPGVEGLTDERKAFEAEWGRRWPGSLKARDDGSYVSHGTQCAWDAWQARAALAAPQAPSQPQSLEWTAEAFATKLQRFVASQKPLDAEMARILLESAWELYEGDEAAPQAPAAPTLTERLQQRCVDWGTYWRAPDSHGVELSIEQAVELLRDALGVEVEVQAPALPAQRAQGPVISQAERINAALLAQAQKHPVVLEIMADCAEATDVETEAMWDDGPYDGSHWRQAASELRQRAAAIRAEDPEIWQEPAAPQEQALHRPAGELPPLPPHPEEHRGRIKWTPKEKGAILVYGELCAKAAEKRFEDGARNMGAALMAYERELQAAQAKIDALMLEYCPDEMTAEQLKEWGKHQRPTRQWYARMIQDTLGDDFVIGAAPPLVPSPSVTLQVGVGTDKPRDHSLTAVSPDVLHGALAAQAQVAVPAGYVLAELTEAQIKAALDAGCWLDTSESRKDFTAAFRAAMLAARPSTPAPKGEQA